jgi:hypothetical protein
MNKQGRSVSELLLKKIRLTSYEGHEKLMNSFHGEKIYINSEAEVIKIVEKAQRIRLDCESAANHNLNRLLDKPGSI